MPIDPATGQRLPYAGEPGAASGAPPMPPGGPGAAPGVPPDGAAAAPMPTPEDEAMGRVTEMASQAPEPSKPYTVKALETLLKQFNETVDILSGGDLPELDVDFGEEKKMHTPIPADLFVPLVALSEALKMVEGGKFADKYDFDPLGMDSDVGVRKATAQLVRLSKDKKLVAAMQAPMGDEEPEVGPAPEMGAMSSEDEELAAGLA